MKNYICTEESRDTILRALNYYCTRNCHSSCSNCAINSARLGFKEVALGIDTPEYYCLTCHQFTEGVEEAEGNGNDGMYCPECHHTIEHRCKSRVLLDIRQHKPEIAFNNEPCSIAKHMDCREIKCPYRHR